MNIQISENHGNQMIEINGRRYIPAMYRSFRPTPSNIALFYRTGVRLCQLLVSGRNSTLRLPYSNFGEVWKGDGVYDFSAFDQQMRMFMQYAPESYFLVMVQLDMPDWWMQAHPGVPDSYRNIGEAVFCREWVDGATEYWKAFLRYAEATYGERIFGYSCAAGLATEWFDDGRFRGASDQKRDAYRAWLGDACASVPSPEAIRDDTMPLFREPASNEARYMRYCAGLTPNLICHLTAEAQSILNHQKLIGLFYGYTDCPSGENDWQNRTCTNGYEQLWRSPDIDMLFSPAAYGECRELRGASSYQYLVDSVKANGKLYLHEIDHRTHLARYPLDNFANLGGYETEFETVMVLRRELCAAAAKGSALWWFDFMGNYYASPEMEAEIVHQMNILVRLYQQERKSVSEIAVFADPMSFLLIKEQTGLPTEYVRSNRNALHECGAPFDYFNLKDLPQINTDSYKMIVFLNAFDIPPDVMHTIRDTLRGRLKVWIHAPNVASDGTLNDAGVESAVGMRLARISGAERKTIRFGDVTFGFSHAVEPMYCVSDERAQPLAFYEDGGVAAARMGENVYIGAGNVPREVWNALARSAGVHIYTEKPGALYADSRFIAWQPRESGAQTLKLTGARRMRECFEGLFCDMKDNELMFTAQADHMYLFCVDEKSV